VGDDIIYILYFVDDQIVIAEDEYDVSYVVRELQEAYKQRGLINKKKCKYIIFGNNEKKHLPLEDDCVSGVVYEYKHLGVIFTKNCYSNGEINNRVNKGRNIITSLNSILRVKA
jgi:hypothetical protein